jgi:hypothetical protein
MLKAIRLHPVSIGILEDKMSDFIEGIHGRIIPS